MPLNYAAMFNWDGKHSVFNLFRTHRSSHTDQIGDKLTACCGKPQTAFWSHRTVSDDHTHAQLSGRSSSARWHPVRTVTFKSLFNPTKIGFVVSEWGVIKWTWYKKGQLLIKEITDRWSSIACRNIRHKSVEPITLQSASLPCVSILLETNTRDSSLMVISFLINFFSKIDV
jgi:hypothetical protein